MAETGIFEKLVTDLNSTERKELLAKLKNLTEISNEPLHREPERESIVNIKLEYKKLGIFQKFFILLQQLFTGKDPLKLVEEMVIKRFMERTQRQASGIVNFNSKKLLDNFCKELITLYNHISKIGDPFRNALETNRKEFFAFFVSLQLEYVQQRLNEELNPQLIYESSKLVEAQEVKDEMIKRFMEILGDITDTEKTKLNHHAFSLHYLYKLCFFNFDGLINRFNDPSWGGVGHLSFTAALKDLARLLDLLQSASYPPAADAIEAIILFYHHDSLKDPDIDIDETIQTSIARVETAFSAIRKFNRTIPLLNIVKCITRNLNYTPKIIKGGDDWFVLFKKYWEEKIGEMYKEFYGSTRKSSFITTTREFLKVDKLPFLAYYNADKAEKNYTFRYPNSMAFISGFYNRIFLKAMNKSLNVLLLQGSFYKQENRTEFTDAYNFLNSLDTKIHALENLLSSSGDMGIRLDKVHTEIMKGNLNQSHLEIILREIDKKVEALIKSMVKSLTSIELILNGVLFAKVGSKYDTISNMKRIGGKKNGDFIASWKISLTLVHKANELLREIFALETKGNA